MISYSILRILGKRLLANYRCLSSKKSWDNSSNSNSSAESYELTSELTHQQIAQENEEVLDIYKERLKYSPIIEEDQEVADRYRDLNLNHGLFGVFDIEDLVETLHHQNGENIFVASVPKDVKYVDYIVVVSGKSKRHMQGIAQTIKRLYKIKRHSTDNVPRLEGENSPDWMALDLGNIALHIFSEKARLLYDLDSLWAVGPKYDEECNKKEPISNLLENYSLDGWEPAK